MEGFRSIVIRHRGKKHEMFIDVTQPVSSFAEALFALTGVVPAKQKILVKGTVLHENTDLQTLGLRDKQVVMLIGTGGEKAERGEHPVNEDVEKLIDTWILPVGLKNIGNTCYLNASLQTLRAIPEIQDALISFESNPRQREICHEMTKGLKLLFGVIGNTRGTHNPFIFHLLLCAKNPRFGPTPTGGLAQQDAEEAWTFLLDNMRHSLFFPGTGGPSKSYNVGPRRSNSVVKRLLAGSMSTTLICEELEGRTQAQFVPTTESFLTLPCHITGEVNHLLGGLVSGLTAQIEKTSKELGRSANFTSTSRISRLPKYLTVHFVRFFWKRRIMKKVKIMRKVTFPHDLDVTELCTEDLRKKLIPVRDKAREVLKEIEEVERNNKKRKQPVSPEAAVETDKKDKEEKKDKKGKKAEGMRFQTDAEIEAAKLASIEKAKEELLELVKAHLAHDPHGNHTGLYELRAVIAHQGANADYGHYTAFVKKGAFVNPMTGEKLEADGNWWWINDDKITEVGRERIDALAGGGESASALILLYGSKPLPIPEVHITEKFLQS